MSKRAIRILNATGGSFTSRKKAVKYLEQGRARYVDDQTIEMIEADYRHISAGRLEAQPMVSQSPTPIRVYEYYGPENLRTFAHYPDSRASFSF